MKHYKNLLLIAVFALGLGFYGVAYASYDVPSPAIVSGHILTWNTSGAGISGQCVPNFYMDGTPPGGSGGFGGGGYWGNSSCSSFSGGIDLNGALFPENINNNYYFQLYNYTGIGLSNHLPIYWTGVAHTWSLSYVAPPPTVTLSAPANGSTQTDLNTNLSVSWSHIDPTIYQSLQITFSYTRNGVSTVSTGYNYAISASTGSFTVPLSTFNFDYNGNWTIMSVAIIKSPQLSDFLQTSDLSSPSGYNLNINFSTLITPFTFSDWPTWYTSNAAGGYSAPSDFGNSFVGFFTPIFQNAFGFANSVLKYFDATQAEAKGQQLGSVFPVTDAYLKKIDLFFGGFPLSAFFLFVVIVMLAIFAIRTIFKFIPFFG